MFYIEYSPTDDHILFQVWLNHYNDMNLDYHIYVQEKDMLLFSERYTYVMNRVVHSEPDSIKLSYKDFLYCYHTNETPETCTMELYVSRDMIRNELANQNTIIGRVFYVPIQQRLMYSTFEIPDYIIYQHATHTNFTIHGIKPIVMNNENQQIKPSSHVVCLSMEVSKYAYENEYYETNIIVYKYANAIEPIVFRNVYIKFMMNVFVNKEKKYGIIWYPKCGCTTIAHIFCELNGIVLEDNQAKRSLNFHIEKYRYNIYLQGIDLIAFVRNPYHRFLSTYIDKHVYKTDSIYLLLDGFSNYQRQFPRDCISNLCDFLLGTNYMTDHTNSLTAYNTISPYFNQLKYKWYKMENGFTERLHSFLKKYHSIDYSPNILGRKENSILQQTNSTKKKKCIANREIKYFDPTQWRTYMEQYNIDYNVLLEDKDLRKKIYSLFQCDFISYNYSENTLT
jgi:hypothetical protein